MAGYQKEILPASWSPIVKYSVYNINSDEKEALGANIKKKWEADNWDTPTLCYGMWTY